ncbi:MAG: adenylosuccinate lyase [Bacteroidetes bacterium]|nr:adenylosuccinate lyase [Bacteroidota bacterium]MCL2303382.1 adenylosuccinate lyase [Lentimicrobiaceae bacterium]
MTVNRLTAISAIDGRYYKQVASLSDYFSEFALIRARVLVEIEYFIALCELPLPQLQTVNPNVFEELRAIYRHFSEEDAWHIIQIENVTNHDVKAVEYFLKEKFDILHLSEYKEFIHFGLTSQDVNNTAIPYLMAAFHRDVWFEEIENVQQLLRQCATEWMRIPMLAHTHGQPASPTTMGKEWFVFYERIENQLALFENIPFCGKFGGATGNFNAHHIAYSNIDWVTFGNKFLEERLGLKRLQTTTQIEHYDMVAAYFDTMKRINTILLDFARDVWTYISMNYFIQKVNEKEIGSSAMPHKVNPIDFENAEGNICIANALFEGLSAKLPVSRLQRDLTDSTVTRNIGVPLAHSIVVLKSLQRGINKLIINKEKLDKDLEKNWAVVAEALQTILRREGYPEPYEALKTATRGKAITKEVISDFIDNLNISEELKKELRSITPQNYIGIQPV